MESEKTFIKTLFEEVSENMEKTNTILLAIENILDILPPSVREYVRNATELLEQDTIKLYYYVVAVDVRQFSKPLQKLHAQAVEKICITIETCRRLSQKE